MRTKQWSLIARLVAMFLIVFFGALEPTLAQDSDALRFFQTNPGRGSLRPSLFRASPAPRTIIPGASEGREFRGANAPARRFPRQDRPLLARPAPSVQEAAKIIVPASTFIHVVGDSLSEFLAQGLKDTMVEKPEIGVIKHSNSSSGIVRDDYFNWGKMLRDLTGGTSKVDLIVMMIGSNDRQPLKDDTGTHEFRSEPWQEIYTKRLDDLMIIARDKRLPMIWVGLPAMQSQKMSADMLYLNGLFRERAARNGVTYVDIWDGFLNDQGQYASIGPDVNGTLVRLRTADGIHMTKAGSRKLAFFVGKETDAQLNRPRNGTEVAALPSEVSEQIRRTSPVPEPKTLQEFMIPPNEPLKAPVIGERPLMGQILILTQPPVTEGGKLFNARVTPAMNEINLLTEQVMAYGRQTTAKTGRADDFRWTPPPAAAAAATPSARQVN